MKKYVVMCAICALALPAFGAGRSMVGGTAHSTASGRMMTMPNNRFTPSIKIDHGVANVPDEPQDNPGVRVVDDDPQPADDHALELAAQKAACVNNNIGAGNTFVWAARDSSTTNYASMVEDTENPDNNTCFVSVGLQSKDARVNISDIQPRYFPVGTTVTCGSWTDETMLEKRILDAKKTVRILSTVGASVGGVGLGVGIMEGFGNDLLAEKTNSKTLQKLGGQKALVKDGDDAAKKAWYVSKLKELRDKNPVVYNTIVCDDADDCDDKGLADEIVVIEGDGKVYLSDVLDETGETFTYAPGTTEVNGELEADDVANTYFNYSKENSSKFVNAEGKFNTARLISDSIAGVVLGTVGGVVTGVVVKKAQVKKGFEDISCVVNGQIIGGYGDELSINID